VGKVARLEGRTLDWARSRFAEYYAGAALEPPVRFARREFAAFPFTPEPMMRRHTAVRTVEEFRELLVREVPRHVYYSSAYYRAPDHPKMDLKGWLGADLIFDLDADHLRGAESRDYAGQLALVKEKLIALVDDFLTGDFGLSASEMQLVFSGGRGYHVHIREEPYLHLNSPERRELVDYVMGSGYDVSDAVRRHREDVTAGPSPDAGPSRAPARRSREFRGLYPPDAPGWRGRMTRGLLRQLDRWEAGGLELTVADLVAAGASPREARHIARDLLEHGRARQIRERLSLEVFPKDVPSALLDLLPKAVAVQVQGETDAPVTTDIHRLIRLPGSLHGGTGFRVIPLSRAELEEFDPLRDGLAPAPTEESVEVELTENVDVEVRRTAIHGATGERRSLSAPAALFLVLRGEARLPS
jgi:DNA primase small subunit